jgi:hypothetical protein
VKFYHQALTSLVLDNELEVLDVIAVDVASRTSEGKVGSQTRISLDHIRSCVSRTDVGISVPDPERVDGVSIERYSNMRKRYCGGEARARDERKHRLVVHYDSRLGIEVLKGVG